MSNKKLYKILSWTWGLPLTLVGYVIIGVLILAGYTPRKWGGCYYFVIGENWGGFCLGSAIVVSSCNYRESVLNHEFGHSIQNCYFGFLCPFIVSIPSFIRCCYREVVVWLKLKKYSELPDYYSIWFEKQASELGEASIKYWSAEHD